MTKRSGFFSALSFLTVLPVGKTRLEPSPNAALFFPIVGVLIGLFIFGVDQFATDFLFPEVRGLFVVALLAVLSGGLHLDGLADSADGLLSHRSREEMLTIMHDPRIGTMGVLALVFCLTFKWVALISLSAPETKYWILAAPAIARVALVAGLVIYPHAKSEGGTHSTFYQKGKWLLLFLAWLPFLILFLNDLGSGVAGLVVFISVFYLFNQFVVGKLGGITGDTLGALCEIMETCIFLVGAVIMANGF
ncbi:MAG: adenosylcobinamide-GDP ribazoletransferase [Candidatus Nitronauta litoralis]|uniref:Adenosylcobinamide-GDP ribazoletransferase n=1 Tax=Candidatus Nitronauta litoralis TaxID=2705533 RepID=A0A7T0BYV1_9BACT|nr:MAG: adenosylcobinamide-GDP ribazoletransferase [Candidatus Nitronauta litoralis]